MALLHWLHSISWLPLPGNIQHSSAVWDEERLFPRTPARCPPPHLRSDLLICLFPVRKSPPLLVLHEEQGCDSGSEKNLDACGQC